jgi:hypothetical protein
MEHVTFDVSVGIVEVDFEIAESTVARADV